MISLPGAVLALYYSTLGVLALFGLHRLLLFGLYYRTRKHRAATPPDPSDWPVVTVQLPLFNEMYVARRLIEAVCAFDYPRNRLEIQVLDDSTDETRDIVARTVARFRAQGIDIRHLRRDRRTGYKAGALEHGLRQARGELLAIFDADFLPEPDFLRRTVPHFADSGVGMVQACWDHLNRNYSLLTRVQAILLDGHFRIEHAARHLSGRFFNFNGTAGVWRRQAILDAGGWQHDTLTEDLDLSYRAQLAGWRFLFLPEVRVPAELPVEINAFKRQQFRWAKGSVQTARKLLPRILGARLPWRVKLEAVVHLTANGTYLLMVLLSVLIVPSTYLRWESGAPTLLFVDLPLFAAATISVLLFYGASQAPDGVSGRRQLRYLPALMALGIGLAVNNSRAVLSGLLHDGGTFERTPKYRIEQAGERWDRKRYRASRNASFLLEGALALYFGVAFAVSLRLGFVGSLPFLYLFLQGYAYVFFLSLGGGRRPAALAAPAA